MENRVEWIVTETSGNIESGYVTCDGQAQFDFERDTETGECRTCGYGAGCFWTDWE